MKKTLIVFVIGIAALASSGLAQSDAEYATWMKAVGATSGSLRKNVAAKVSDAAAADADKLNGVFKQVTAFWEKRGGADAITAAQTAATAAAKVSLAAKAGNWDEAAGELKTYSSTCAGCHMAHRAGSPQEGFTIK